MLNFERYYFLFCYIKYYYLKYLKKNFPCLIKILDLTKTSFEFEINEGYNIA